MGLKTWSSLSLHSGLPPSLLRPSLFSWHTSSLLPLLPPFPPLSFPSSLLPLLPPSPPPSNQGKGYKLSRASLLRKGYIKQVNPCELRSILPHGEKNFQGIKYYTLVKKYERSSQGETPMEEVKKEEEEEEEEEEGETG